MESDDLIYRKLQKHLDRMPVGFPESKSGTDIKILKELFTPEEVEIALELSMLPETAAKIYPRVKHLFSGVAELESKLDAMYRKGLIIGGKLLEKDPKVKLYSNAQFAIGIYEFQVNRMSKNLANNFLDYFNNDFAVEFKDSSGISQIHTIPVMKSILRENYTETYERIRDIVNKASEPVVINNCVCRQARDLAGDKCKTTDLRETCIALDSLASHLIEKGIGRIISKDEALKLLEKFEEAGLVVQPQNNMNPEFICCCCGCCCGALTVVKQFPKPAEQYKSNYYASVDIDKCAGCGTCESRCQMDAISVKDEKAVVDPDRCIGCGLCTTTCKTGAVTLNRKENTITPPKDQNDMYQKILIKKIGPVAALKTMVKYKLGMKV